MTNTTTPSNMASDGFDGHNVIAVSFEADRKA